MAVVASAEAGLRAAPRATILQIRSPALGTRAFLREATKLIASSPIPVLVSSRCDVALATGAAGVNLPQRDITVADARVLLGERLIGRSVHTMDGAVVAEQDGADFVIFGPVWPTASHRESVAAGVGALTDVARAVSIPVLAIGGVTKQRIRECREAGAAGYAAIGLFE